MNKFIERFLVWSIFLLGMNFFVALLYGNDMTENTAGSVNTGEMSPGIAIIYATLFLLCFLIAVQRYRLMQQAFTRCLPVLALVGLSFLSTAWSLDPGVTFRRSCFLAGTTIFGIYIGARYSLTRIANLLIEAYCILLGFSVIFLALAPQMVLDAAHGNIFEGLTLHKNNLGEYTAHIVILLLCTRPPLGKPSLKVLAMVAAGGVLAMTRSASSILMCAAVLAMSPLAYTLRFTKKQLLPIGTVTAVVLCSALAFFLSSLDTVLSLVGRDASLTGRPLIWQSVLVAISKRPLLGYGFDVFFRGVKGPSLDVIAAAGWLVPHSHNGFLQLMLDLGVVGLSLFVAILVLYVVRALRYARQVSDHAALWPLGFVMLFVLHALPEASLVTRQGLVWIVFAALYTRLAMDRSARRATYEESDFAMSDSLTASEATGIPAIPIAS